MENDAILNDFINHNFKLYFMPIITIYKNPSDYPNLYVARLFDLEKSTKIITTADNLITIRQKIPKHLERIRRDNEDDPIIIESYI